MEVRNRRVRVTILYLIILCALIGSISAYVYIQISRELSGSFSGIIDVSRVFGGESEDIAGIRAAVLRSEQTADYLAWLAANRVEEFQKSPGDFDESTIVTPEETRHNYYAMSDFWKTQLEENNIRVDLIDEGELVSEEIMSDYNLLVLPAAYCLSDDQIDVVKGFLVNRRSVIMSHYSGNRTEDGGDRQWSMLADIVGSELTALSAERMEDSAANLIFSGDNPVAADIAPGRRLPISTYDRPVAARILDTARSKPAAVWPNAAGLLPSRPQDRAGVIYGDYRGGRFVWIGFTAQSVHSGPRYWPSFERLIHNSLHWTGRLPTVGRSPWPENFTSAAAIGVVNKDGYRGSFSTEQLLRTANIPHAVFIQPRGPQVAIPSSPRDDLEVEAGLIYDQPSQGAAMGEVEINQANSEYNEFVKKWDVDVEGVVFLETPDNLFKPSESLRYEYMWLTEERMYAPRLVPFGRGLKRPFFSRVPARLAVIGQSARDDRHLMNGVRANDVDNLADHLSRDLERIRSLGGLYSVSLHADYGDQFWENARLNEWFGELKSPDIWLTTPSRIAEWWKLYYGVKLQVYQEGARYTLRVSNDGNEVVPSIRVFIYPGILPETLDIRAERLRTPIPSYEIVSGQRRIELTLEDLNPHENRTYYIDF